MRERFRFFLTVMAVIALSVSACGGETSDDAAPSTAAPTADGAGGNVAPPESAAPAETDDGSEDTASTPEPDQAGDLSLVPPGETDILGNPAGQGFVVLDGVRHDFVLNGACQKIFGALQASGAAADGSDAGVDSIIPPENWETDTAAGWDPPSIQIKIADDRWLAEAGSEHLVGGENVELTPEQSSVASFTNDGDRVTGEATFYSQYNYEEIETTTGTFEFYCP